MDRVRDIATGLWDFTSTHMSYICNLDENLLSLKEEGEWLGSQRNDIRRKVEAFEREPRMRRAEEVDKWLTSAEKVLNELDKILAEGFGRSVDKLLGGCCPKNLLSTYKIGKQIVNTLESARRLRDMGKGFHLDSALVVRMPAMSFLMPEFVVENTVGLDPEVERVWGYIMDERIRVIRLCGIGGVGKSTLLKIVSNAFHKKSHDFDVVIWAKVSRQKDYIEKLREAIWRKLDTSDHDLLNRWASEEEKGAQIFNVLKNKKFVLLLDDVWEGLGIHLQRDDPNLSTVIYTTCSVKLLNAMNAQDTIEVKCLPPYEALRLFRMTVGENFLNGHPWLSELAQIIARTCGGLPLALLTVGRAMVCRKNPREWHRAIQLIHTNPSEIKGFEDDVFSLLKFSYDCLNNATTQSCFLYCSIFPKDYNIRIDELIDLWTGDGFLDALNPRNDGEYDLMNLNNMFESMT